jgi:hypothetical protein
MALKVDPDELQRALDILQGLDALLHHSGSSSVDALSTTDAIQADFNTWNDSGSQAVVSRHAELHKEVLFYTSSLASVAGQLAGLMQSTIATVRSTENSTKTGLVKTADTLGSNSPSPTPTDRKKAV